MSLISNVGAYTYTDKISALAVAPSPYNNGGNNYNIIYIGTSNGHVYLFNEQLNTIQSVVPTGYTGTLSGEITGLAVDPAGKYLFVNAPSDNHCLRIPLISVDFLSVASTVTAPIDRDIYRFGDNIGDITVDSQGVVYIVTGYGRSISIIERYGNSFIDLLFQNEGPALSFKGITLSPNEQRIYAADSQFGSVYYYDFLSNQPTFDILNAPGVFSQLGGLAASGNNIFYTQKDGVYAENSYLRTLVRVAGNGLTTYVATTDPQRYTLIGTNAVTSDVFGNIYLSSSNVLGQSQLYKVSFELVARQGYQPPPARQQLPIMQPYPTTSCKRIVEPFSPRLRFGWGLTNTRKPPILDLVKSPLCCPPPIVNCPVTPFYCLPAPKPSVPVEPVAPIYPITVATRQFGDHGDATGFRTNIYQTATVVATTSLVFIAESSSVQAGMGPLGEVYYLGGTGTLTKLHNGLATSSFFSMGSPSRIAGPVVSTTGAIVVVTDYGMLYRLSSNAAVYQYYPIKLGQQVAGTPACITNNAFDYIVAGYGNTIGAFRASNASTAWSATTQVPGELFITSVATDGINVFAATNTKNVYCYVAETGTLNWVYPVTTAGSSVFTPYVTSKNIGITARNDSNIFILSNTTVRQSGYDITVTFPGIRIVSPPVLSTDVQGMLWAHVITDTGTLYGFGGIFSSASGPSYQYLWSTIFVDELPTQYQIPVIDSAGFIYTSSVYGVVNQYNAYYTGGSTQIKNTSFIINKTETELNRPIQVSLTPLITSQNTMYVIGRDTLPTSPTYRTNYMYTLSGEAIAQPVISFTLTFAFTQRTTGLQTGALWNSIASSSDGTLLAICSSDGYIYTSSNSGQTWIQRTTGLPTNVTRWASIGIGRGTSFLVVCSSDGLVYRSTNGGANWTLITTGLPAGLPLTTVFFVAAIFFYIVCSSNGYIYTSKQNTPPTKVVWLRVGTSLPAGTPWMSIACATANNSLVICSSNGYIYTSGDSGQTWTQRILGLPTNGARWKSVASSQTGQFLAVCSSDGVVCVSPNYGIGWVQVTANGLPSAVAWTSIAVSLDGMYVAVCSDSGLIYTSSYFGYTWKQQTSGLPSGAVWRSIAANDNFTQLAVVGDNGLVYTASIVV